jgi:hypothetical protein
MATFQTKVDVDSCTTITLFKTIAKLVNELNVKNVKCMNCKPHSVGMFVEAAQHYVPSSKDIIPVDSDGKPELKDWTDTSFCNNKPTWELQGITKGYFPSSTFMDSDSEDRPVPMLMFGIEIDPNADYNQK